MEITMKKFIRYYNTVIADLISIIMVVIFTIIAVQYSKMPAAGNSDSGFPFMDGWQAPDGSKMSLIDVKTGDITISHNLDVNTLGKQLCMVSADTEIIAEFNGIETYRYAPEQHNLIGVSYGMDIHMINIPSSAKYVTLKLHSLYPQNPVYIRDLSIEDDGKFVMDVYRKGLPSFVICVMIVLFGLVMVIMGFTNLRNDDNNTVNFFSIGTLAILVGIWSANDTLILQIFTGRPEIIKFMTYLCLIFVAYMPVSFIANAAAGAHISSEESKHSDKITNNPVSDIMLKILLALVTINFLVTIFVSLLGITDVHGMLPFSHINIIIAMIMTVYLIINACRHKTIEKRFLVTIIIGMGAALIGTIVDLIRFNLNPNSTLGSSFGTRSGVFVFIVMVGIHLMHEHKRLAVEHGRAELMQKMAYTDGLTELANRAAYHEKEGEIPAQGKHCFIVQLDINFLKKVNDVYGHAEGDKHIINSARIIRDSFEGIGTAYRTGGDEFVVIAEDCDESAIEPALRRIDASSAAYNETEHPPVPIQLAYGWAEYKPGEDEFEEVVKLADKRMYDNKVAMKGVRTD